MKRISALCLAFVATSSMNAFAQEILIRGAKLHTGSEQGTLESSDILVRDGKIASIGPNLSSGENATVIEAKGRPVTPGLFGGLSTIGIVEVPAEDATEDATLALGGPVWQQQWRPEFDVTLAFNPRTVLVPVTRIEGPTWTVLRPANEESVIAGQGAAVSLDGRFDAVLDGSRSLFVTMGSDADDQSGGSRAAQYMLLDQAIREVRVAGPIQQGALLHPAGREALATYLRGGRVVFSVHRASDIRAVIAFARRNGMKPVIEGGREAWLVAEDLARADVPVILNPLDDLPSDFDRLGSRLDNAALLQRAGVRIAFTDADSRKVRQVAGNAVAHGLPWDAALAAITSTPADIFGLGRSRGHLAPGQVADLVLWSGDPLEVTTVAEQVWIGGKAIEMRSRQIELRDRYLEKVKAQRAR